MAGFMNEMKSFLIRIIWECRCKSESKPHIRLALNLGVTYRKFGSNSWSHLVYNVLGFWRCEVPQSWTWYFILDQFDLDPVRGILIRIVLCNGNRAIDIHKWILLYNIKLLYNLEIILFSGVWPGISVIFSPSWMHISGKTRILTDLWRAG